ncbi:MAG: lysostaphin resistance A-like protein [Cellulosilyticaceae bacterium]
MKYILKASKCILFTFAMLFLFIGTQQIISIVVEMMFGQEIIVNNMYLLTMIGYIITILGIGVLNKIDGTSILMYYKGFTRKMFEKTLLYVIPLWLLVTLINGLMSPFFPTYEAEIGSLFVSKEPFLRSLVLVIGAPFIEEYIFRGKIQDYVKKYFGVKVSVIFQGIIFGIIHPFGLQKIYASVLGIGLGFLREKVGHIMAPTCVHIFINFVGWLAGIMM